jgi:hypothetical protein
MERVSVLEGDAAAVIGHLTQATVFFLYCPFGGARLEGVIDQLASLAEARTIRVCTVDLPVLERAWLTPVSLTGELAVYRSVR